MKEENKTLFKLSKTGAILQFIVIAREIEDGSVLITRKGQINGATQEDIEPMYPKNVGRANETTPWQQSLLMHESKVNKLMDKGYKYIPEWEALEYSELARILLRLQGTDALGNNLPMLAQKDTTKIKYPGYAQRKYDGVRCVFKRIAGVITARSRRGKVFSALDHLCDLFDKYLPLGYELDGELYHHDRSLQQIVSLVKREQPATKEIGYRVYDLIGTDLPYQKRLMIIRRIVKRVNNPLIIVAPTYKVFSEDRVWKLFKKFREEGYEGAMWRDPNSLYECGTRSWGLIKIKDFDEGEFEITDVEEATGRDAGTAIFICETDEGEEFNVRPMGTRAVRAEYLDNFYDKYLGKYLTVRHQGWTDDGKPFHARGVIIRDYE
jgi:DNA ligase-1